MMNDFDEQLNTFSLPETYNQTTLFFERYWLANAEYWEKWLPIQDSIFEENAKHLPDLMFRPEFGILPLPGINIFTSEEDFRLLQSCMKQTGDRSFVVIQNKEVVISVYYGEHGKDDWRIHPLLRFRFPSDISWAEMMSGGYASTELFQGAAKDYFVFGDSGSWGRYVANSYENPSAAPLFSTPINVMGFKKEYSELFREHFEPLVQPEVVSEWLPEAYRKLLIF